ncbi:DNA gyrase subunit B [Streptomyces sp. NPDC004787]|uniref:DNA gyrase subunit B n=1 Tax=Streptomyces sp. NPDC004787 TaxID=3154291 RepID=UPI0033BA7A66
MYELLDRPVNEVLAGHASRVEVTLMADGRIRVEDDGPGNEERLGLEGRAEPRRRDRRTVDLSYVGAPVGNALSRELTAKVRRDGVRRVRRFERGVALGPAVTAGPAAGHGTTLVFRPDGDIFETVECAFDVLLERFRELALLNRELDLTLTDQRAGDGAAPRSVRCRFPGGARDFVEFLDTGTAPFRPVDPVHPDIVHVEREIPRLAGTVEVALRWSEGPGAGIRSFVNSAATPAGGTHVEGLLDGIAAAFGLPEATSTGLTAVVSVKLDDPVLEGATRGRLGGSGVRDGVADVVREHLSAWLAAHPERGRDVLRRLTRP